MHDGKLVEVGNVEDIFRHPKHPYTKALIESILIPDPHMERQRAGEKKMSKKEISIYILKKYCCFWQVFFVVSDRILYFQTGAGDPLVSYYGERVEKMSPEEHDWAMEKLGLNESVSVQYVKWLSNAFHGEFGISYKYKMDVLEVISGRVGNTMSLGGIGFVLIFTLALLLGILCAWHEEKWLDKIICQVGTVTSCIPEFWFSLVLILFFAVELHILPSSGAYTIGKEKDTADRIQHLILPVTVVVLGHLWYYAYMIRNKILEEVRADYVLLAKSKDLQKTAFFSAIVSAILFRVI